MRRGVVLIGEFGSGKSTIAQALADAYGFKRYSFAKPLKEFLALAYGPVVKDDTYRVGDRFLTGRQLLQEFGTEVVRGFDPDFWINAAFRTMVEEPHVQWAIDDMRFANEFDMLRTLDFYVVRLVGRGIEVPEGERAHVSESMHERFTAGLTVQNDGQLSPRKVAELIVSMMGRK